MGWFDRSNKASKADSKKPATPLLVIEGLDVYYGRAHALQEVSLTLATGVQGIVGRNGMGKTTLCNAITGLVPAGGSIKLVGEEILGLAPHQITQRGIAYVPQGRRVWPSLSVDETLKLVARNKRDIDRVYSMFPRLAERRGNGGGQLSGGEQQMLAIGRALLLEPRLLVMDEPTEGLAPVIVEHVAQSLRTLVAEGDIAILLIEQNLGVALQVADNIGVMVNGRIAHRMPAAQLAADRALQEQLLGVRSGGGHDAAPEEPDAAAASASQAVNEPARIYTVQRAHSAKDGSTDAPLPSTTAAPAYNRWNSGGAAVPTAIAAATPAATSAATATGAALPPSQRPATATHNAAQVLEFPVAATSVRAAYVAGTFDTKARELFFIRQCLEKLGLRVVTVDLSTAGKPSPASVHPREVARHHPSGEAAVFSGDRGSAVAAMAVAFERYVLTRRDLGGLISAGGSGGTSLATPGMRALPIGVPKVMVSTMASGDTRPYVGPSDICMMYAVTDVQGINRISERVLANAAHALAGMVTHPPAVSAITKPALGLTMFGVTTPCVQAVAKQLEDSYDCLIFHATGVGGQSLEKLVDSHMLVGAIDVSTTEIADEIVGGVLSAGPTRLDVFARHAVPYVGSCGALDMVNFGGFESVPERFKARKLYRHNPTVTLMRTTADECRAIGEFIATKLNAMQGPVRFLIPEGGVSAIDKPGQPFHDPEADRVLFATIEQHFRAGPQRQLLRLPHHINDEAFATALVAAWQQVAGPLSAAGFALSANQSR
jgi:uncharacterized protein (UPF0261 family)/ABC-type branched-subunit amino acid transport system ATPase component